MVRKQPVKRPTLRPEVLYRSPEEGHMMRFYDKPRPWGDPRPFGKSVIKPCQPCAIIPCPSLKATRDLVSFAKTADGRAFLHGSPH